VRKMAKRNAALAARVNKTADITGVSKDFVRKVINGERENETVFSVYMSLYEGENELVKEVKKLVPMISTRRMKGEPVRRTA
jgi:hypothetical protein